MKDKLARIKRVIRNLPETNSSSSHSVVICTDKKYLIDKKDSLYNLHVDSDGTLLIPNRGDDFGWEYEKYNDPMEKIWYVCGILFGNYYNNQKLRRLFEDVLMKFTGATCIKYEWVENRKNHPENYDSDDTYNSGYPEIDHNSSDVFPEIVESRESMKNFIFNTRSWLFLGNDNSDSPSNFYNEEEKEPDAIFSVDLGGDIGRVDVEVLNFDEICHSARRIISEFIYDDVLSTIVYDVVNKKFIYSSSSYSILSNNNNNYLNLTHLEDTDKLYWISGKLSKEIFSLYKNKSKAGLLRNGFYKGDEMKELLDMYKDHIVSVPIHVKTKEFGIIQ